MALKTDYKDDIPKTENRRYQMIHNDDGTVSFVDVTEYTQVGDTFGAGDINETNESVNRKVESTDIVNHNLVTEHGFAADALQVKEDFSELNKNILEANILDLSGNNTLIAIRIGKHCYLHINGFTSNGSESGEFADISKAFAPIGIIFIKVTILGVGDGILQIDNNGKCTLFNHDMSQHVSGTIYGIASYLL